MNHPALYVAEQGVIQGRGVLTSAPLRPGEVVWTLDADAQIVPWAEVERWTAEQREAFQWIAYQCSADALAVCDGLGRYMNHSCDPNTWWADSCTLVARRDIRAGEEVTCDYACTDILMSYAWPCRCGSECCRGTVSNRDYLDPAWQARYGLHLPAHVLAAIERARR